MHLKDNDLNMCKLNVLETAKSCKYYEYFFFTYVLLNPRNGVFSFGKDPFKEAMSKYKVWVKTRSSVLYER